MNRLACLHCSVSCSAVWDLLNHVIGKKHRETVTLMKSEEPKHEGRLYYFLENYLDDVPVLGLECVAVRQADTGYRYTCTLCDKEGNWWDMTLHITAMEHMESYIKRHHGELISWFRFFTKDERLTAMINAARSIPTKLGCGKRRVSSPTAEEDDMESDALPSAEDDFLTEQGTRLPQDPEMAEEWLAPTTVPQGKNACSLCGTPCSSLRLKCHHILSNEHKEVLGRVAPEQLKDVGRLGHFLLCYMKDYPVLGLEYIAELGPGPRYKLSCQLCCLDGHLPKMIKHIRGVLHPLSYIRKHHGNMLSSVQNCTKRDEYVKALGDVAVRILQRHGRKEVQTTSTVDFTESECLPESDDQRRKAVEDQGDVPPSKHDRVRGAHSQRRPSPYREAGLDKNHERSNCNTMEENSNNDGSPSAKRVRLIPDGDQDALAYRPHTSEYWGSSYNERLDYTTAEQELEFRTNCQFLEYLANFSIDDSEDAIFIQKVTQNCINAFISFQDAEIKRQRSSHAGRGSIGARKQN